MFLLLIDHVIEGLRLLRPFMNAHTMLSEAGDYIWVHQFSGPELAVDEDTKARLANIDWHFNAVEGWGHVLSR